MGILDNFRFTNSNSKVTAGKQGADVPAEETGLTGFGNSLVDNLKKATGLGGAFERLEGKLGKGGKEEEKAEPTKQFFQAGGKQYERDPRIKIRIPTSYLKGPAGHLASVGDKAVVFPYTPQIVVQTRANYNAINPTHTNYTFYAYQNSMLDAISIVGTFSAQSLEDGRYMLGAIHALRSVTKMNFGPSQNSGAPPPICRLDGYGAYQFNNLPVVISSFFYTLNEDVDYMQITDKNSGKATNVPTRAEFTIECLPVFSRRDQANFNIDKFISGSLTETKGMI